MFYTQIMRKRDDSKERKIQNAVAEIILTEGAAAVSTTRVAKKSESRNRMFTFILRTRKH